MWERFQGFLLNVTMTILLIVSLVVVSIGGYVATRSLLAWAELV